MWLLYPWMAECGVSESERLKQHMYHLNFFGRNKMFGSSAILNFDKVKQASARYAKDPAITYQYGTAGFRCLESTLDPVMLRVGILAAMRSRCLDSQNVGVMITASHNPEHDNGVKIVDPMGEMMSQEWEVLATELANVNSDQLAAVCIRMFNRLGIDYGRDANVVVARDTRASGSRLARALADGIKCVGGRMVDYGEMTTPELHYMVRCLNTTTTAKRPKEEPYGVPTEAGYFEKLSTAFKNVVKHNTAPSGQLVVDCANGVGAPKMEMLAEAVAATGWRFKLVNVDIRGTGCLNNGCGADYVKVGQKLPQGLSTADGPIRRGCSLDGDADRLVYYFQQESDGKFCLLDGDKIAALAASFIKSSLVQLKPYGCDVSIGVVQTAYANGSSTRFFQRSGIPVICAETGVKNLHHRAEEFDVGIYFEANGHGTVLFSPKYVETMREIGTKSLPDDVRAVHAALSELPKLVNQAVGDALSDMLMVEAILAWKGWSLGDWARLLYTDLPNRQLKVKVANRNLFKTTDADRVLVEPAGIQDLVNGRVAKYVDGRSFVRPSGTEDVVRVYAEASTQDLCDELAYGVAGDVFDKAGGVGERPEFKKV
eukprot:Partr_v1_DN26980_c2_g1_i1_m7345 putative Phosphoacetylglucosamine mutase